MSLPTSKEDVRFFTCTDGHTKRTWVFVNDHLCSRAEQGKSGVCRVVWGSGTVEVLPTYEQALKQAIPAPCPF
jgi:hypothetical protein